MSQREAAKDENREKIKLAAAKIIRKEGMERLTMRHLATAAGVSLRTPYNLFGSKTEVLIALLEDASASLNAGLASQNEKLVVERMIGALDDMADFVSADETFYQKIFWAVMASEQTETRFEGYERLIAVCQAFVADAVAGKELVADIDADDFGKHLAIQLMSIMGMWGSEFFDSAECASHVRQSWCSNLLTVATRKSKPFLTDVAMG